MEAKPSIKKPLRSKDVKKPLRSKDVKKPSRLRNVEEMLARYGYHITKLQGDLANVTSPQFKNDIEHLQWRVHEIKKRLDMIEKVLAPEKNSIGWLRKLLGAREE